MSNIRLNTVEEINNILEGALIDSNEIVRIGNENFFKIDEVNGETFWADEDLVAEYEYEYTHQPEAADGVDTFFNTVQSVSLDDLTFVLQTIGSRITNESITASFQDINTYLSQGSLTDVESGTPLRSYNDIKDAINGDVSTKILFVKNKTGN